MKRTNRAPYSNFRERFSDLIGSPRLISYLEFIHLVLKVHDTGPGVPEEKRESIFQPYVRINQSTFGSGLGLYDCK
eukprot:968734-Amorphochlora_amoeboformis.AAC.1